MGRGLGPKRPGMLASLTGAERSDDTRSYSLSTGNQTLDAGGARRPPSGDHDGPGPRRAPAGAAAAVQGDCGVKGAAGGGEPDGLHTGDQARNTASTAGAADAGFPDPAPSWA